MPALPLLFLLLTVLSGGGIAYFVGGATVLAFITEDHARFLAALPQRVMGQLNVFAFLAMPLFILTGELMNRGGITKAIEAVRQLRGEAHPAVQVKDCSLALASGPGMVVGGGHNHATVILERE